jgi:hypothetical protein
VDNGVGAGADTEDDMIDELSAKPDFSDDDSDGGGGDIADDEVLKDEK